MGKLLWILLAFLALAAIEAAVRLTLLNFVIELLLE